MFAVIFSNRTGMSGDIDYLLKVVAKDIADYDSIYHKLPRSRPCTMSVLLSRCRKSNR